MNEWDIDNALERYRDHPVLGPASQTLYNLKQAVQANSDGWPYWYAPRAAASKLMVLIEGRRPMVHARERRDREDATLAALRAALGPVKAFRSRHHLDFDVVESAEEMPKPPAPTYRVTLVMESRDSDRTGRPVRQDVLLASIVQRALEASSELVQHFPGQSITITSELTGHPDPYPHSSPQQLLVAGTERGR